MLVSLRMFLILYFNDNSINVLYYYKPLMLFFRRYKYYSIKVSFI